MAKAATKVAVTVDLADDFMKMFGGNDDESTVKHFLSTGYAPLDFALSSRYHDGGMPGGRIIEMAGPPSSGKTAIATAVMIEAQRRGGIAAFFDHERSFSQKLGEQMGLDIKPGRWIYKKPRTFEESLALCVQIALHVRKGKRIPAEAPIVFVFDSLASMVPQSVLFDKDGKERGLDTRNMNDTTALARATSAVFPAFAQYMEELDVTAIFLNQVRTKVGVMYGDPRTTPGGDSPKFYASVRIMLNAAAKIKKAGAKAGDAPEAMAISAAVIKNKVSRPFLTASWRFGFQPDGTGKFDVARSSIDFLADQGVLTIPKAGYIEWEGKTLHRDALARFLEQSGRVEELVAMMPANYEPAVVDPDMLTGDLLETAVLEEAA